MKITIITVALNEIKTIQKTLSSVAKQSYADIEHIIVDGGSSDGTFELAAEYAKTVKYPVKLIKQTYNGHIYGALNEGIIHASGDIIATLHANDFYTSEDEISKVVDAFTQSGASMIYGNVYFVNSKGKRSRTYSAKKFKKELLLNGFMPPHPACFIKKELFEKYGLYANEYIIAGDFELLIRMFLNNVEPIAYLDRDIVAMSPGGISQQIKNRIFVTNREKFKALKDNNFNINPIRLLKRYLYI